MPDDLSEAALALAVISGQAGVRREALLTDHRVPMIIPAPGISPAIATFNH